ncbi:LysE family transporter, partial [Citrobacter freundii]|uniref:LysE family transporter n=1 Tax=Citrobacter freundii TaxID=546 RepID=UPI0021B7DBB8
LMMSLWDALRMNMMISYQELVRTFPKAILFYVSFFVQFIDVNAPHSGLSFFILAITLEIVSFFYLSFLIFSGAFVTQYIRTKKKLAKVGNSLIGLIFVGFAARLATLQS